MAFNLKLLSKIDQRTKDCVHGWIRGMEKKLNLRHIENIICSICILYNRDIDTFGTVSSTHEISDNKAKLTKVSNDEDWENNNYGLIAIRSHDNKALYQWDLKIHKDSSKQGIGGIVVGISSRVEPEQDVDDIAGHHYCYLNTAKKCVGDLTSEGMRWDDYGQPYGGGDEVSIHLDLYKKFVKFFVNGQDQGIAYANIASNESIEYRLMVSLYYVDDSVEILGFTKQ